jgi:hypothetical protein
VPSKECPSTEYSYLTRISRLKLSEVEVSLLSVCKIRPSVLGQLRAAMPQKTLFKLEIVSKPPTKMKIEQNETIRGSMVFFTVSAMDLSAWANYLMRNNFAEYVNRIMGNRCVEHQKVPACMEVAFAAYETQ